MRITKLLLICVCCVLVVPTVWGQTANTAAKPGILGYLDPHTGAFRPLPSAVEDAAEAPALTTFGGTITVSFTITVKTTTLTAITCSVEVSVSDAITTGSPRFYGESATSAATGSGGTRLCKVTVPYSWALSSPATDMMSTSYVVSGVGGTNTLPQHSTTLSPLDSRKVPANGAATPLAVAVTL